MEEWKNIIGYEGLYQVSSYGRVKSLGNDKTRKEKLLKPKTNGRGYLLVCLNKDGKQNFYFVHRLVTQAFIPNPDNLPQVNHKDENKLNNCVSNLEWCTCKYNINYGTRTEKISKEVYQYSLDDKLIKVWNSTQECGRNGFSFQHISECCNGKRKTHKGYIWKYKKDVV